MPSHKLFSEILIDASPQRVWDILINFPLHEEWNPFIRYIRGKPAVGTRLEVRMQPSGSRGITFRPTVLKAEPGAEFRWLGHLLVTGLFDGEHIFEIRPAQNGQTRFIQREILSGLAVPLLRSTLDRDTLRGFREMNQAFKERAENLA